MKKIIKVTVRILISIIVVILIPIFILAIPINHVEMQIDTDNGSMQELIKDEVTQNEEAIGGYSPNPKYYIK